MTVKGLVIAFVYFLGATSFADSEIVIPQKRVRECRFGQDIFLQDREGFRVDLIRYNQGEYPEKNAPLLVILPPTGGANQIDKSFGISFCNAGYTVLVLKSYTGSDEVSLDLGVHQRVIGKSVRAFEMIRIKYKSDFFGILGTSAGGIVATTLVDDLKDDLDALFTIVTGAPLHAVIARAGERGLKDLRALRMKQFSFDTIEEYEKALFENLEVKIPENPPPGLKIGMAIALEDTTVPTIFQQNLVDWWKPSFLIRMQRGHTSGIGSVAVQHRGKVLDFFNSAAGL